MYEKSVAYYDIIYSFKNCEKESERLDEIIRQHKKSDEYLGAFKEAGLETICDPEGLIVRGLYIGVKPAV